MGIFRANWEISLPRWRDGHNLWPIPLHEALGHLRAIYEGASEVVEWAVPFDDLTVARLDVVRHFTSGGRTDELLRGLHELPIGNHKARALHDASLGANALSVAVKGRWKAQLYDKAKQIHELIKGADPQEQYILKEILPLAQEILRYEVRMWYPVLKDKALHRVSLLSEDKLLKAALKYFEDNGFGAAVGGTTFIKNGIERILASPRSKEAVAAAGQLLFDGYGIEAPNDSKTIRSRRKLYAAYDLSPASLWASSDETVELNFATGLVEIVGATKDQQSPLEAAFDDATVGPENSSPHVDQAENRGVCRQHRPAQPGSTDCLVATGYERHRGSPGQWRESGDSCCLRCFGSSIRYALANAEVPFAYTMHKGADLAGPVRPEVGRHLLGKEQCR